MAERPLPYGPFTAEVRRFLQQLAALTPAAEAQVVAEYGRAIKSAEYQAAERMLGGAIARSGRERERDALGGPLLQLLRVERPQGEPKSAHANATLTPIHVTPVNAPPSATLTPILDASPFRPIAEPALAALLAVLMQDVLSAELFVRLYAPFERTIPRASAQQ